MRVIASFLFMFDSIERRGKQLAGLWDTLVSHIGILGLIVMKSEAKDREKLATGLLQRLLRHFLHICRAIANAVL